MSIVENMLAATERGRKADAAAGLAAKDAEIERLRSERDHWHIECARWNNKWTEAFAELERLWAAIDKAVEIFDAPGITKGNWYDATEILRRARRERLET